jgi:hypothetical protein
MSSKRSSVCGAVTVLCVGIWTTGGCEKQQVPTPAATANPPTQLVAVTTQPATEPTTQPAATTLLINQLFKQFPGGRLRLVTTDDHVTAILYSSDPPTAINNDYTGNSYYLKMPLDDVKDAAAINGAEWRFKSISSDRSDSNDGIFLDGFRHQLQPINLLVRFEGSGSTLRVRLQGEFMDYDNSAPRQPGMLSSVSGDILVDVDLPTKQ